MRDQIGVFYYPDFQTDLTTILKAILLFDELHLMDRPSVFFGTGTGQLGSVGAYSPFRQIEQQIRDEGMPFFVHDAPYGQMHGEWYEQVTADINDAEFLRRFQHGLKTSPTFRAFQVAPGNYGKYGNQDDVVGRLLEVDISEVVKSARPIDILEDPAVQPFNLSTPEGCAKQLIADAAFCSAKINLALTVRTRDGLFPLADAAPYGHLLGAKYARAINALEPAENRIQITDLSFAIFDELISSDRLHSLSVKQALDYRKNSQHAREALLEHLAAIQTKQSAIGADGDYVGAIQDVIESEIRPAVRDYRNKLQAIDE